MHSLACWGHVEVHRTSSGGGGQSCGRDVGGESHGNVNKIRKLKWLSGNNGRYTDNDTKVMTRKCKMATRRQFQVAEGVSRLRVTYASGHLSRPTTTPPSYAGSPTVELVNTDKNLVLVRRSPFYHDRVVVLPPSFELTKRRFFYPQVSCRQRCSLLAR